MLKLAERFHRRGNSPAIKMLPRPDFRQKEETSHVLRRDPFGKRGCGSACTLGVLLRGLSAEARGRAAFTHAKLQLVCWLSAR